MALAFLDHDRFYFAWIAFIPFLFAIEGASVRRAYLVGALSGFIGFSLATYWIVDFVQISKGLSVTISWFIGIAVWLYCAQQTALIAASYVLIRRLSNVPVFLLFPVVVVALLAGFPMLFSMRIGESQVNFLPAIQAADIFGVHGVDFIVALFSVLVFSGLISLKYKQNTGRRFYWVIGIAIIVSWFAYGTVMQRSWQARIATWPRLSVGIVQPNEIPKLGKRLIYPGYSLAYPPEMAMSEELASAGAELIVWPEAQRKEYLDNVFVTEAFSSAVEAMGADLLFQDTATDGKNMSNANGQRNTAILIGADGKEVGLYDKIKLIPFGETVPLFTSDSTLGSLIRGLLGDYLNEITPGDTPKVFTQRRVDIVPFICYESTFPEFVASSIKQTFDQGRGNSGKIIAALSNDGWFGSTHQPQLHIPVSALRAVENRLPLIHAANNGPSIVADASGKIIQRTQFQKAGGYLVDTPYPPEHKLSFYSRYPNLFVNGIYLTFLILLILSFVRRHQH